jgi:hypothetical protein
MSGHAIHVKIEGRSYSGTFTVDRGVLTVKTSYGTKKTEVPPKLKHDELAHQLLTTLVKEEKARKGSTL